MDCQLCRLCKFELGCWIASLGLRTKRHQQTTKWTIAFFFRFANCPFGWFCYFSLLYCTFMQPKQKKKQKKLTCEVNVGRCACRFRAIVDIRILHMNRNQHRAANDDYYDCRYRNKACELRMGLVMVDHPFDEVEFLTRLHFFACLSTLTPKGR